MRLKRSLYLPVATILLAAGIVVLPGARVPILRGVGHLLVSADPSVQHVDVIVSAIDAGPAGLLEAADLVFDGVSDRVAVFVTPPGKVDLELIARGVPFQDLEVVYREQLHALGVASVISLPRVSGSEDQGRVLPGWCEEHELTSILVVTSWHHSRRVHRVLKRAMDGHQTVVAVRSSRYADFSPNDWWRSRHGARTVIVEFQKLVADFVSHPIS